MEARQLHRIPERVLAALDEVAVVFRQRGVRLSLFGSLAETFPMSHRGADLDIGYEIGEGNAEPEATERDLRRAMDALPTVRAVDLVNFNRADPAFVRTVRENAIPLPIRHG